MSHILRASKSGRYPRRAGRQYRNVLTEMQQVVLNDYQQHYESNGVPPTVREQAERLAIQISSIQYARNAIEEKGITLVRAHAHNVNQRKPRPLPEGRHTIAVYGITLSQAADLLEQLAIELADRGDHQRAGACLLGAEAVRR